ncbi:MAG: hypothetical protein MJZ81_06040 [Bacteroidales bacterium]|nr:hypothetical protein [Bacteroidales bacterium]
MRWMKMYESLLSWEWSADVPVFNLWIHLLLMANTRDMEWKGETVPRGSLVTTVKELSEQTGLSAMQIRTALEKLRLTNNITTKTTNKNTIVSICDYVSYQGSSEGRQQTKQQTVQQTDNKQAKEKESNTKKIENNEEYKENTPIGVQKKAEDAAEKTVKDAGKAAKHRVRDKEGKVIPGILLTGEEFRKLKEDYGDEAEGIVKFLSDYKREKTYSGHDDNLAIRRWVVNAYRKKKAEDERYARPAAARPAGRTGDVTDVNELWKKK